MNFGLIIRNALNKSELPISSSEHLSLAKSYCNNNIQAIWYRVNPDWRTARSTLTTISGTAEYALEELFDGFVRNSLRGPSTNPRILRYKSPDQFFRLVNPVSTSTGDPFWHTFGKFAGFDLQLVTPGTVKTKSSLANKTSNDVNVKAGSFIVSSDSTIFTLNDVGLMFQRDGDSVFYKIAQFINTTQVKLTTKYRGVTGSNVSYKVGDIGIDVNVQGIVGGVIDSEVGVLNGTTDVALTKTFSSIIGISKGGLTGGKVIVQTDDESIILGTMSPGETEVERQTTILHPIPDSVEILPYRFYSKHPILRMDSDRLLIPSKYHPLIEAFTTSSLLEWADRAVPASVSGFMVAGLLELENDAEDSSLENNVPQDVGVGTHLGAFDNNLDQDFIGSRFL